MSANIESMDLLLMDLVDYTQDRIAEYSHLVTAKEAFEVVTIVPLALTDKVSEPHLRAHNLLATLDRYHDLIRTHEETWSEEEKAQSNSEITTH